METIHCLKCGADELVLSFGELLDCRYTRAEIVVKQPIVARPLAQPASHENCAEVPALVHNRCRGVSICNMHDPVVGRSYCRSAVLWDLRQIEGWQYPEYRLRSKGDQHVLGNRLLSLQNAPERVCPFVADCKLQTFPALPAHHKLRAVNEHGHFLAQLTIDATPAQIRRQKGMRVNGDQLLVRVTERLK